MYSTSGKNSQKSRNYKENYEYFFKSFLILENRPYKRLLFCYTNRQLKTTRANLRSETKAVCVKATLLGKQFLHERGRHGCAGCNLQLTNLQDGNLQDGNLVSMRRQAADSVRE